MGDDEKRSDDGRQELPEEDLAFLRAMEGLEVRRRERARAERDPGTDGEVVELPPDQTEDAIFESYMRDFESGRRGQAPDESPPPRQSKTQAPEPTAPRPSQGALRSLRRRLRKGEIEPAAQLDLHGRTRAQALNDLDQFLRKSHSAKLEVVLVITGRGLHSADLGVLREMVPMLLRRRWSKLVHEVVGAPPRLGGEGAFVVFLRPSATD